MEDITLRREAEQTIAEQKLALEHEVERTGHTLLRAQKELRDLAAHLFTVQEEERQIVARELHDDVAQRLSALAMGNRQARAEDDLASKNVTIDRLYAGLESLNTDVRQISHRLHPAILHDLGLPAALKSLVDDFREREKMFATYLGTNVPDRIPDTPATAAFRITQEALRNVSKHAGKTHVKVLLEGRDGLLRLEVRDFGIGFDGDTEEPQPGLGLISMKERARIARGHVAVRSSLGEGTSIVLEVPLDDQT